MIHDDRVRFARTLAVLSEQYREAISDVRAEALFDALSDLPIEAVEQAARAYLRTGKFFPAPVELRELVAGNTRDQALTMFVRLRDEVRHTGYYRTPTLTEAEEAMVRKVWGSWQALCESLPAPHDERYAWEQKRFVEAFEAQAHQQALLPAAPPPLPARDARRLVETIKKRGALRPVGGK